MTSSNNSAAKKTDRAPVREALRLYDLQSRRPLQTLLALPASIQVVAQSFDAFGVEGFVADAILVWREFSQVLWSDFFRYIVPQLRIEISDRQADLLTLSILCLVPIGDALILRRGESWPSVLRRVEAYWAKHSGTPSQALRTFTRHWNATFPRLMLLLFAAIFVTPHVLALWALAQDGELRAWAALGFLILIVGLVVMPVANERPADAFVALSAERAAEDWGHVGEFLIMLFTFGFFYGVFLFYLHPEILYRNAFDGTPAELTTLNVILAGIGALCLFAVQATNWRSLPWLLINAAFIVVFAYATEFVRELPLAESIGDYFRGRLSDAQG